jgi:hypothetical protein
VINTPALLVHHKGEDKFYLGGDRLWFSASSLQGPWALAQSPPPEVTALAPESGTATTREEPVPRIVVRLRPAELLVTSGLPDFRPIRGTALQYAADTDSQLFFHATRREAVPVAVGPVVQGEVTRGPWTHVPRMTCLRTSRRFLPAPRRPWCWPRCRTHRRRNSPSWPIPSRPPPTVKPAATPPRTGL